MVFNANLLHGWGAVSGSTVTRRPPVQGCCKVPIHALDLVKRARRSARSESRQRSWRRQADRHIALTSEPSTAPHAGGPPDRWLGWSDSASCLPSLQVRPRNADFAMALGPCRLRLIDPEPLRAGAILRARRPASGRPRRTDCLHLHECSSAWG